MPHPIDDVVVDGISVIKSSFRSFHKERVRLRVASVAEVVNGDYSEAFGLDLAGFFYDRSSDVTLQHDALNVLVDAVGTVFVRTTVGFFTVGMFGGDADAAAAAAFAQRVPLYLAAGTATLTIDPTAQAAANTNAARHAVIQDACDWQATCIVLNNATLKILIAGNGVHVVEGQIFRGSFSEQACPTPLCVEMGTPTLNPISTGASAISVGTKTGKVTHVHVTAGGNSFTSAPTVVFTGGGAGSGAAATAFIAGGAVIAVVMTNMGTGYTSVPTVSFTGGGGASAAAEAKTNLNLYPVTVTLQNALPANVAVGMPVGLRDVDGSNGCPAINGAAILAAFDAGAKTISFDWCAPFAGTVTTGTPTAGEVMFPPCWLEVHGGYTGFLSAKEGYLNASNGAQIRTQVFARWGDGANQASKSNQCFLMAGKAQGDVHVNANSIIVGFPSAQVRIIQGSAYLNQVCIGGGGFGDDGVRTQLCSRVQIIRSAVGNCKGTNIRIDVGDQLGTGLTEFGSCATCIDNQGGSLSLRTAKISHCLVGARTISGGNTYLGESDVTFNACTTGINWVGGLFTGTALFVGCDADTIGSIPQNTNARGGGYFATSPPDDNLRVMGLTLGVGGGTLAKTLTTSVLHNFGSIAAGAYATLNITLVGVNNDGKWICKVDPSAALNDGLVMASACHGSNTIRVTLFNATGSAIDPANMTFRATALGVA